MILFLTIVIATLGPLLLGSGPGVILPVIVIFWLTGLASAFGIPVTVNGGVDAFRLVPSTVLGVVLTLIGFGISLVVQYVGHAIQPTEGVSLRTALDGGPLNRPHPLFWEHEGNRAVRSGNWKIVCLYPEAWELYDIAADRVERDNIAAQHLDVVKRLSDEWDAWAKRTNVDPWPGPARLPWGDDAPARGGR